MRPTQCAIFAALILAVVLALPADASAPSLARRAYTLAARADRHATAALKAARLAGPAGLNGVDGARGVAGPQGDPGTDGRNGREGIQGEKGERGLQGVEGAAGPTGPEGIASLNVTSVALPATYRLNGYIGMQTVISAPFTRDHAGTVLASFESQVNGENAFPTVVYCELRVDGTTIAERATAIGGNDYRSFVGSDPVELAAGDHSLVLACLIGSQLADVDLPAGRTRITILGA